MSDQTTESAETDTPAEATTSNPPADAPVPAGLAVIMEREAAIESRASELKAREAKVAQWEKMESLSPAEKAQALGISLQDLQKSMVDNYDPNAAVTAKLTALERKILEADQRRDAERLEAEKRAEMDKIRTFIDGSEEFPLTKVNSFHEAVIDAVKMSAKSGKPISEAQAASNVEAGLLDLVDKAMSIPSIREKYFKAVEEEAAEPSSSKTLTNKLSSNSAKPRTNPALLEGQEALDSFISMLGTVSE